MRDTELKLKGKWESRHDLMVDYGWVSLDAPEQRLMKSKDQEAG